MDTAWIETDVPARLDRLPWSRWHTLVVVALGITWLLDGLEVTLAVVGALGFGYATDLLGRKRLFLITLALYLLATAATAFSFDFASYALFRALTGAGIGGEYAAINSAIDKLIPARVRGHVDLGINASFWIGAAIGAGASIVLLDPHRVREELGWRLAFGIGATLGLLILWLRRYVPESPRWLLIHGASGEADRIVAGIEERVARDHGPLAPAQGTLRLHARHRTPWGEIWRSLVHDHRRRSLLGLALM